MNDVVKTLMEYNLPREVAEKIDLEARHMHFKESKIDTFEKTSEYALKVRIKPFGSNVPWYTVGLNKWGFASFVDSIISPYTMEDITNIQASTTYSNLCMSHHTEARNYMWEMENPLKRDPTQPSSDIIEVVNRYIEYKQRPYEREYYLT